MMGPIQTANQRNFKKINVLRSLNRTHISNIIRFLRPKMGNGLAYSGGNSLENIGIENCANIVFP